MDDSRSQADSSPRLPAIAWQTLTWFASLKLAVMLLVGIRGRAGRGHPPRIRQRTRVRPVVRLQEPLVHGPAGSAGTEHSGGHDRPLSVAAGTSRVLAGPCRGAGALGRGDRQPSWPASKANSAWKKASPAIRW